MNTHRERLPLAGGQDYGTWQVRLTAVDIGHPVQAPSNDAHQGDKAMETVSRLQATVLDATAGLEDFMKTLNGLITNDKFCLSRQGELQLTWWRRPLRLRENRA